MRHINKIIFLLLALTSVGCGKKGIVDPKLQVYMDRFSQDIGVDVSYIDAKFGTLEGITVGVCKQGAFLSEITIDRGYWDFTTASDREELVMHELGHCALNLNHNEGRIPVTNCPISIMFPYVFGSDVCYTGNRPHYIAQLKASKNLTMYDNSTVSKQSDYVIIDDSVAP